ncbi:unnamed protein product, partial [Pylaiella littoralis]
LVPAWYTANATAVTVHVQERYLQRTLHPTLLWVHLLGFFRAESIPSARGEMPVEWEGDRQRVRARARRRMILWAIVSMCMVCSALYGKVLTHRQAAEYGPQDCPKRWVSGSKTHAGSCWCGWDGYCMCTPSLAIDTVVEVFDPTTGEVGSVLVVRRRDNGKLACIGGFVEVGETLEQATRREVREETGLEVTSLQMIPRVYDDPARDARRHTVSVVYVARTTGVPRAGSDAAEVVSIPLASLQGQLGDFAFDHGQIFTDYLALGGRQASTMTAIGPPPPQQDLTGGVSGSD